MIPTINKSARVTRKTATVTDHFFTNFLIDTVFKTEILKTDISDHFPIWYLSQYSLPQENKDKNTFIYKRTYNSECINSFKQKLYEIECNEIEALQNPKEVYKTFLKIFSLYLITIFQKKRKKNENIKIYRAFG